MVLGPIELNGKRYALYAPIRQYVVQQQSPAFRTEGPQSRKSNQKLIQFPFKNAQAGFGARRVDGETGEGAGQFFDSTLDTRFVPITLPILDEDSTEATDDKRISASAAFKSDFWTLWEGKTGSDIGIFSRKFVGGTTTWTAGGTVLTADTTAKVPQDLMPHKTHLIALLVKANDHLIQRSTDGVTWSAATAGITANLLASNIGESSIIDAGMLADIGGEAVAVIWHEADGTITFFSSTNAGDNWTDEAVDIPSGNGPQGVAVFPTIDGTDRLYVATREGIWEVDTSPATWTTRLILPLPNNNDNGRRMTVHQGAELWVPIGVGDDSPAPLYRITVEGDRRIIDTRFGLDHGDGVPDEMLGPFRWLHSVGKFLFGSVGGGKAGRNARVLCHNGLGWHSMFRNATANEVIPWIGYADDDDATPRLHFDRRNTSTGSSDTFFLAEPLVNGESGVSIKRQDGASDRAYIEWPELVIMPHDTGAFYQALVDDGGSLSASTSGEYIRLDADVDGTAPTTDRGDFLSGDKDLDFGTSSRGVSGRTIRLKEFFFRDSGTNTDTPKQWDFEIRMKKNLKKLRGRLLPIDITATAALELELRDSEQVFADLDTAIESDTLVPLTIGRSAEMQVEVIGIQDAVEEVETEQKEVDLGRRTGRMVVQVEEML